VGEVSAGEGRGTGSSPARVCIQRKGQNERSRRKRGGRGGEGYKRVREDCGATDRERETMATGYYGKSEKLQAQRKARGGRTEDGEMKRDGTINERKREGTCICMGKAGAGRRGLEGERESDRDAATPSRRGATRGREGSKRKGGNGRSERASEREGRRRRGRGRDG